MSKPLKDVIPCGKEHRFGLPRQKSEPDLAATITRAASTQTYYTIRFLVDRNLIPDAYRTYAYFRWVDDCLDADTGSKPERMAFIDRQVSILETYYRRKLPGSLPDDLSAEEQMLADLINHDIEPNSGLQAYLHNMMAVMIFDVERRGRLISKAELAEYSRLLATAVTEALFYFIGHNCPSPCQEMRYLAVQGAHVVHMLRDAIEDTASGYFNIPAEYIEAHGLDLQDIDSTAYREWVRSRVTLASGYFRAGDFYISQVQNLRCRLAGFAYAARFKWMLHTIQRDGYRLRAEYPERKGRQAGLWIAWTTLSSLLTWHKKKTEPGRLAVHQQVRIEEQ